MDTPEPSQKQDIPGPQENINLGAQEQLVVLDDDLRVQGASMSFYTGFQAAPGQKLAEIGDGRWNIPALLDRLKELEKVDDEFSDIEVEYDVPALGRRTILLSARRLSGNDAQGAKILLTIRSSKGQELVGVDTSDTLVRCRATLAGIAYAIIVTDPECNVTFMNATAETLTGWSQSEALHKQVKDIFITVSERPILNEEEPIGRVIRDGVGVVLSKYRILMARDGSEWPIDGNVAPMPDGAGGLLGVVLVFHDVSNRRQSEQELEISEVRYRRLFESAHDGILILDAVTTKVLDVNPFMTNLLGYPREHFLGKELWEFGVFKDSEISKQAMLTLQRLGRIRYEDLPLLHKDGRQVPVEFVSNVYREGRRNVIQCNIRDITERKLLSERLEKATLAAEAANRSKSDFLANMSHEIRTPLGAILGFAEMLMTKNPEECEQIGCIQIIRRNSLHLLELINEILDLSKVEAGHLKAERVTCELPELLGEVVSLMRPRAKEKWLRFGITFEGPIPRRIITDPMRLRQILVNLVGNAVKFTDYGKIELKAADEGAGGPNIVLRIEVTDTGIGLTPEQLGRLFLPFTQGDASITRKFGGTGLGLTISRQLARLLGGDITVTSQSGIGSTFTLKIDGGSSAGVEQLQGLTELTLPNMNTKKMQIKLRLRGRVLLVEDGADNQRLLQMQLGDAGALVTIAGNGRIAVELAAKQTFDLILMDMQMPVMDGYAATKELRSRGLTMPIIALTAYAMAEDRDKCIASGCNSYLSKPMDEEDLLRVVHQYLGNDSSPVPTDSAGLGLGSALLAGNAACGTILASNSIKSSHADNPRIMELVPEFVAGLPGKVQKMADLLAKNDLPALQRIAHDLSGTCGGYGFVPVTQPARTVERSIKEGKALDSITAEVKSLVALIRQIDGYNESKELVPT